MATRKKTSRTRPTRAAFRLQPATRRDRPLWKAMRMDLYSGLEEPFHDRDIERILTLRERSCLLVRAPNNDVVGFIEVSLRNIVDGCAGSPVGYVEGIYLVPDYRGIGLGAVLLDLASDWFKKKKCSEMATDTEIDNEDAQAFWAEAGFEETWRVVQYRKAIAASRGGRKRVRK